MNNDCQGTGLVSVSVLDQIKRGEYSKIQSILNDTNSFQRDNKALSIMESMTGQNEGLIKNLSLSVEGRHLLDRLYYELTDGSLNDRETEQAARILDAISPKGQEYIEAIDRAMIFPSKPPGLTTPLDEATLKADLVDGGKIRIRIPQHNQSRDEFRQGWVPSDEAFHKGIILKDNEIVGIKRDGKITYAPALALVEVYNQGQTKTLHKMS